MKIKKGLIIIIPVITLMACSGKIDNEVSKNHSSPIAGTWQLITGTLIEKGDTVVTDYTKNISFIKIINDTHFSFLQHDLNKGKDSTAIFVAGRGRYVLDDSIYTEHLEYCSARNWEGNDFKFTIDIKNDTLIQSGIEKIDSLDVNRINIEKYVKMD